MSELATQPETEIEREPTSRVSLRLAVPNCGKVLIFLGFTQLRARGILVAEPSKKIPPSEYLLTPPWRRGAYRHEPYEFIN
jgi:hypothetical protein